MNTLTEDKVHSAYLDSDGSLHLYDKQENALEGWPEGWPEKIGCPSTFLKERHIWMVNAPRKMSLAEQVAEQLAPECGLPPPGWKCTRKAGHEGPCAAVKYHIITSDKPWIGVDLDATLAHYDDWRGIDHIGPPIEAMQTRVKQWLSEGKHVRILTARVGPQRHDVPHTIEEITHHIEQWCLHHLGQVLPVTCQKDYNMVAFYDDRCIQVIPNTGRILEDEQWDTNARNFRLRQALQHYATADFLTTEQKMRAEYALAHHPAPVISLEQHEAAIADLNERLIDRTTGFMQTLGQQSLEIAQWKSACQTEQTNAQIWATEVGEAIRQVEASHQLNRQLLAALQQAYVHNQNMHCFQTKGRLNDQLNEQTHVLRKALGIPDQQPAEKTSVSFLSDDPAGDWPEDFTHENGNYSIPCRVCGKTFLGYKRRTVCKKCVAIKETLVSHAGLDAKEAAAIQAGLNSPAEEDPYQSEDYQRFVAKTAETCEAEDGPCDACLAGGICDGPSETPDSQRLTMILPYTPAEADAAHDQWHAMCGHFSIAVATGRPLEDIRTAGVPLKGWMNPTMISTTLRALGVSYMKSSFAGIGDYTTPESARESSDAMLHLVGSDDSQKAILRIQWEGSWMNPGVPKGAQYQRTHYIAIKSGRIMDPAMGPNIHMPVGLWLQEVPKVVSQVKGATGYHFTHAWTITP